VAIILAAGISLSLLTMTVATLYSAFVRLGAGGPGLSENATQVLTGWGGGMIGVLGAYVGYAFGKRANGNDNGS
jgi:hypothetical protein